MDILFTGGAFRDVKSLQPLSLSDLRCKLLGCKSQEERQSGTNTPRYSDKVLTGNWYEERTLCPCPKDEWITIYKTNFKTYHPKDKKAELITLWKIKERTQGTGRKIVDDDSYLENMTSSYDLSFRILPKGLCGPRKRVYNARTITWIPETDLTLSYGNQTKYGLIDSIKEKQANDEKIIVPSQSIYQVDYIEQKDSKIINDKRFPKPRGDMNTPDLRHLGINLTSRPTPWEPQYRYSRCENVCTWL